MSRGYRTAAVVLCWLLASAYHYASFSYEPNEERRASRTAGEVLRWMGMMRRLYQAVAIILWTVAAWLVIP